MEVPYGVIINARRAADGNLLVELRDLTNAVNAIAEQKDFAKWFSTVRITESRVTDRSHWVGLEIDMPIHSSTLESIREEKEAEND